MVGGFLSSLFGKSVSPGINPHGDNSRGYLKPEIDQGGYADTKVHISGLMGSKDPNHTALGEHKDGSHASDALVTGLCKVHTLTKERLEEMSIQDLRSILNRNLPVRLNFAL